MQNKNIIFSLIVSLISVFTIKSDNTQLDILYRNRKYVGIFVPSDPVIRNIKYGNWGSRPYEYGWVNYVVPVKGKKVIDLGVGLPSQYNWYHYVVNNLQPEFYAGIDFDGRIRNELIVQDNFEIMYMNMAQLEYPDKSFDVAYCISTFEHIPYDIFMKSIQEAHRVLKDDGLLVITLDEEWDKNEPITYSNGWNTLEQSLMQNGLFKRIKRSFGLPEFLSLIQDYFTLYQDDAVIVGDVIRSNQNNFVYYERRNRDAKILNSGIRINSCVSYALLKKKK